jgi:hypothetical protein
MGQLYQFVSLLLKVTLCRVLLVVCVMTPISLAFVGVYDEDPPLWNFTMDLVINCSFFVDLVLTFFSAYEDQKLNIIDNR